ncbi:hypothetical protein [Devosia sp. Root105]|uniref:hypothetical protein n=1 Tax=Devosia sp. Root105 TaxID=1736423 RepID=UPI0006FC1935|nr:hypothetical protein [Devosia sp. Root105]KQU95202.1 hypothetical protein ASC68_18800 [Devosia sp. Root105]
MDRYHYTPDMIPKRPLTRLEAHHFAAAAPNRWPYTREKHRLLSEFARTNEMQTTTRGFDLSTLAAPPGPRPRSSKAGVPPVSGFDHVQYFRRYRLPVAILTEPYEPEEHLEDIREHAETLGLLVHTPPNLYASFHFPGWTGCILITRPDFGRVLWLDDQLDFETQGLVT